MTLRVLGTAFAVAEGGDLINDDGPTLGPALAYVSAAGGIDLMTGLTDRTRLPLKHTILSPDRTVLGALVLRNGPQGTMELNATGAGSLNLRTDTGVDLDLLAEGNLIDVHYGDAYLHTWVIEAPQEDTTDERQAALSYSGRGDLALLDNAVLYPERPVDLDTSEDRFFNFGSEDGPWRIASEWSRPKQIAMRTSYRWPAPKLWPKTVAAYWIWTSNPDRASRDGDRYFRTTLSLDSTTRVRILAVGDEDLMLMVDGRQVLRQRFNKWRKTRAVNLTLGPGDHLIAARVGHDYRRRMHASGDGKGAGLLLAVVTMGVRKIVTKKDGHRTVKKRAVVRSVLLRSRTKGWVVRGPRDGPPGWFPSQVLSTFVTEAQGRGVLGFDGIGFGYTDAKDSAGVPWRRRVAASYKVGTTGLDLLRQLVEHGLDVAMIEGTLHAWDSRGRNLRHSVALDGEVSSTGTRVATIHPTAMLTRWRRGWAEFTQPHSTARVEATLSDGASDDRASAKSSAGSALEEYAEAQETFTVVTNSLRGPQPGYHYGVGDTVTSPVPGGSRGAARVLSIGYAEQEGGVVEWSHQMLLVGDHGDPADVPPGV